MYFAHVAQLAEHMHGKHEVIGSIPIVGSAKKRFARERGCDIIRELVFEIEVVAGGKAV